MPHVQVNAKYGDKTALHCAAAAGRVSVVKLLIDYQADIHAQVANYTYTYMFELSSEAQ